ncbi:hypothetical protein BDB00DRAFT_800708 [Zychaea mexicana]|uniref:uncharacterized protein n=1 Tax=Zychaea mexicana TaxID=64656 RepID=UPI0022FEEAA9|nr:uncharacterized protein BDB00DRAFT_800708 [Zychaea mexicana]KAI9498025.1 hypothetical protein BDB00DRAFT_800708 [Zychaea mexicana]
MMFSYCTLDDYLQIQSLLQHEQRRRDRAIQQHVQQHHEALRRRRAQQYRLARAMHNLKMLKETYRRERAYRIQRYMEYYRNQTLIAAVEDAFYRQCLASAIEQRRAEAVRQQYRQIEQQQQLNYSNYSNNQEAEDSDEDDDKGFEDFHATQLAELLRLLFDRQQLEEQVKQQQQAQPNNPEQQQQQQREVTDASDQEEAHDLWNYITHLQDEQKDKVEQPKRVKEQTASAAGDENEAMGPEPEPATRVLESMQQPAISAAPDSNGQQVDGYDELVNQDVNKILHRQQAHVREPEAVNVIDNRAGAPERPYMESTNINNDDEYDNDVDQEEASPPLQDRVLNLKDLLDQLVSDESSDHAASTSPDAEQDADKFSKTAADYDDDGVEDDDDAVLFEPKSVVTDAEPTPQQEDAPAINTPQRTQPTATTQPNQQQEQEDLVHKIAEQQKQNLPPADPAKYEELQQVDRQLQEIQANRLATVLRTPLQFENKSGTLHLTATTPDNREFLGCEDEIMRTMLKLDTISSNGDEGVRGERKALVKKAEGMLEQLDGHKQVEWEMARMSKKGGGGERHHKEKNRKNRHHKQKQHRHHQQRSKAGGITV